MLFLGSFVNALVDVLAIIGIILVGGFVIFFLGDLVLSVLDPNYSRFGKKKAKKQEEETKEEVKELPKVEEKQEAIEFKAEPEVKEPEIVEEEFKFDDEPKSEIEEINEAKEDALSDIRAEEEVFKANMLKAIEERQQAKQQEEKSITNNFFFDDEDLNAFDENEEIAEGEEVEPEIASEPVVVEEEEASEPVAEEAETVEEPAVEEPVAEEPAAEEVVETPVDNEELINLRKEMEEERAKFEAEKLALIAEKEELAKKLEQEENAENAPAGSLEEYEARLDVLKTRLADNEKEFRKVKKEYLPLRKVARTLESDEKKLRRKEALVAKQKVVLYGVNNIGDIDEEKAKKLAEDLDILEGFKLSVQHCQEVMEANKERYPILENTFNILSQNNETIRNDIADVEKAIEALKAETENNTDAN